MYEAYVGMAQRQSWGASVLQAVMLWLPHSISLPCSPIRTMRPVEPNKGTDL